MGWTRAPGTYIVEVSQVWSQWEKMCLILERLEAPGKGNTQWWGERGSALLETRGEENRMRNCGRESGRWAMAGM